MNVDEMEAGPQMDKAIAETMPGWVRVSNDDARGGNSTVWMFYRGERVLRGTPYKGRKTYGHSFADWSPSRDIAAAWEVVETVKWMAPAIYRGYSFEWGCRMGDAHGEGDTPALAICRAYLKAQEASKGSALAPSVATDTPASTDAG